LLLYGGWGLWIERRVEQRLAALHAAGEPVYPGDFEPAMPARGMNGAEDLIEAGAKGRASGEMLADDRLTASYVIGVPLMDTEMAAIARVVSANEAAFKLVESGLGKPQVKWPADYGRVLTLQSNEWLTNVRAVATLLQIDALHAHQ